MVKLGDCKFCPKRLGKKIIYTRGIAIKRDKSN